MTDNDQTGITLVGKEFRVSAKETVSTGEYENFEPFAAIEGEIQREGTHADGAPLTDEERKRVKQELLSLHKDLQDIIERSSANRIAISDAEKWEFEDGTDAD